jgi:multidrug efflux pump subunit AcrB
MSKLAKMRLGVLTNNAAVGVFLVFITLLMFLRISVALTTTLGLPIVFLAGLYILDISGVTLNMISMMGFIMVLGMLVDDAIIIGENITYHMEQGMKPRQAAVKGATELMGPVTATVLTTIVAFGPMMFVSGMMGKFIIAIPIVVITLLALSWFESFFILPSHVAFFTHPEKHPPERSWLQWVEDKYGQILEWVIHWRKSTFILSLLVFVGAIVLAATTMRFELFPPVAVDTVTMDVTAESGTSLNTMRQNLSQVDLKLRSLIDESNLENTILGSGRIVNDQDGSMKQGPRYGQIRLLYKPAVSRPDHDAVADMRLLEKALPAAFPHLDFVFKEVRPGPPTGRPLEVELSGNNLDSVVKVAERLENYIQGIEGVTSIESGLEAGDPEIHVVLDRELATYAGVNLNVAATHVRAAIDGLRATSVRRGTEEVDVTIRLPHNGSTLDEVLGRIQLPNNRGGLVNLSEIARFEERSGFSSVRHKDGIRVITVVGNIDSKIITSAELNALVAKNKDQWLGDDAKEVKAKYGGEAEANFESIRDLMASFLLAIIGIFFILAVQFNNFRYPLVVMIAIPYGAIGIIVSFFLHDLLWKPMPLSFFTVLGMVALTGVVVNSSLILLAFIQRAREEGMHWHDAIVNAGKRRLRAVLLTATTTILGLLPTAYGWGGEDPVVAPMALALAWGLIFGTVITLIVIPAITAVGINAKVVINERIKPFIRAKTLERMPWFKN